MNRAPIPPNELQAASNPDWPAEWASGLAALAMNGALRPETAQRLLGAVSLVRRDLAIKQLVELLDPTGSRSRWSIALELAGRLSRFEATGWPRWRWSDRQPIDRIEALLLAIMRGGGPRSARRLADLL